MKRWVSFLVVAVVVLSAAAAIDYGCYYDDEEQDSATCRVSFGASVYSCSKNGEITLTILNVTSHGYANYFNASRSHIEISNTTFGLIPEKAMLSSSGETAKSKLFLVDSPTPPFTATVTYTSDNSVSNRKEFEEELEMIDDFNEIELNVTQAVFDPATKKISLSGNVLGISGTTKIIYALINYEKRIVVESVQSAFDKDFEYTFDKDYSPKDMGNLKVAVIVWQDTPFALGVVKPTIAAFNDYSLDVTAPETIGPEKRFELSVKITNFVNQVDTYSIEVETPEGWQSEVIPETEILPGEWKKFELSVMPPRDFKGTQTLRVVTTSRLAPINHTEELRLSPEKRFDAEVEIYPYPKPVAAKPFNITLFFNSTGTIDDTIKYVVFTMPYVKTEGIEKSMTLPPGIRLFRQEDTILDACALDEDDSLKAKTLHELRLLASMLEEELLDEDIERVEELVGLQNSRIIHVRDLSSSETIASLGLDIREFCDMLKLIEEDAPSRDYLDRRKSDLLEDLDYERAEIKSNLNSLFTDEEGAPACKLASSLTYWIVGLTKSDFSFFNSTRDVQLASSSRIVLDLRDDYGRPIEYSTIQAGEFKQFKLYIRNTFNEARDFMIVPSESVIEVDTTDEIGIDAGKTDYAYVSVSVPYQLPEGIYMVDISVSSEPYVEVFPLTIDVSRLGVALSARSQYEFEPGVSNVSLLLVNTGSGNDTYFLSLEGEGWLKVPPQVSLTGGEEAQIPLSISRSRSIEEGVPYGFILTVRSVSSENVEESIGFDVIVTSTSPAELMDRLRDVEADFRTLRATCPDYDASSIKNDIDEAQRYINEGRGAAEIYIQSAEDDIFYAKRQCGPKEMDTGLLMIVLLILALGGAAYYYFAKIKPSAKKNTMEDYAKKYIEEKKAK